MFGDLQNHGGLAIIPARRADIAHALADIGHIFELDRRAFAVGHNNAFVVIDRFKLCIGGENFGAAHSLKRAERAQRVCIDDCCADGIDAKANGR